MSHFGRSGPPDIRDTYSLLVLNITFRTTAHDLFPLFDRCGKVVDIFIPKDKRSGESRGFAFVRYKHEDEAQKAVERLDGKVVDGREIMVQFAKYGPSAEPIQRGRITEENPRWRSSRSRSPSPRRPRYRDDRYDSRGRERDYRHRRLSRDRYERDRYQGRGRDYRRRSRSRSPSQSISRSRSRSPIDGRKRDRKASPYGDRSASPVKRSPACRRSSSPRRRSVSPVRQNISPDNRSASPIGRDQFRNQSISPVTRGRRSSSPKKSDAEE